MRKHRASRHLEHAKALLIDSALYACKPVTSSALKARSRTPLQRYIRHLFFDFLDTAWNDFGSDSPEASLLMHLRCLPWDECKEYALRVALKVCHSSADTMTLQLLLWPKAVGQWREPVF
jgi:hypothetical protein